MAEVAVRRQLPSSIPNIDSLEGFGTDANDEYSTFKKLQRQLEYVALHRKSAATTDLGPGTSTCRKSTSKTSRGTVLMAGYSTPTPAEHPIEI